MKEAKRQLAAIMFTDIVGYSSMSHKNEAHALEVLEEHRRIARPLFTKFQGTEIKTIGDAFLVKFESAIEAVRCAIELQSALDEHSFDDPQNKIQIRIGIHLGDVVLTDGDVYGDGVNIAARLQTHARSGGICISGSVYQQVHNQIDRKISFIKRQRLKNIEKPVAIFSVNPHKPSTVGEPAPRFSERFLRPFFRFRKPLTIGSAAVLLFTLVSTWATRQQRGPGRGPAGAPSQFDRKRLAVLPFRNSSQSASDDYLSEGITEELTTGLSRIEGLRVLARNSVTRFQAQGKSVQQIGSELQVGTVIQGSIRKSGDQIRVSVQVIDVGTQEITWTRDYDGKISDTLEIQRRISQQFESQFRGRTLAFAAPAPTTPPAEEKEAYLAYLRGKYFLNKRTEDSLTRGVQELEMSVKMNPGNAQAYAALANAAGLRSYYGMIHPQEAAKQVLKLTDQALAIDPALTEALMSLAETKAFFQYDWTGAEKTFQQAIRSNPAQPTAHQWYAEYLAFMRRPEEARKEVAIALQLDPLSLVTQTASGVIEYYARDYEKAIRKYQAALDMDPEYLLSNFWIGQALVQSGKAAQGIPYLEKAARLSNRSSLTLSALAYAHGIQGAKAKALKIIAELKSQGLKRYVSSYDLAIAYAGVEDTDQMLQALDRAVAERATRAALLSVDPAFDRVRGRTRFTALLSQLGQ